MGEAASTAPRQSQSDARTGGFSRGGRVHDNMLLALDRVRQLSRLLQQRAEEEK